MADASSRPWHSPSRTPQPVVRKIMHLRWKQRLDRVPIAAQMGMAASTVHQLLARCKISRLSHVNRVTGEPARRGTAQRRGLVRPARRHRGALLDACLAFLSL